MSEIKTFRAVNWNTPDNDYVEMFWEQNLKQFWIDTEYIPSKDIDSWKSLSPEMRDAYKKALSLGCSDDRINKQIKWLESNMYSL